MSAKAEIDTAIVTIRLHDDNATADELRKQAMETFLEATAVMKDIGTQGAVGFHAERRDPGPRGYGTRWDQPRPTQEVG